MTEGSWLPLAAPTKRRLAKWLGSWPALLVFLVGVALLIVGACCDRESIAPCLLFAGAGASCLLTARTLYAMDRRFDAFAIRKEDAPMLPELGDPRGVLVRIWVIQGHAVTGEDRGAMWIEDGRLTFCGHRTSFVLNRGDVLNEELARKPGPGQFAIALRRPTPVGPMAVSFTPLFGDRPYRTPLNVTLERWLSCSGGDEPPSQFPPTALGPGTVSSAAIVRSALRRAVGETSFFGLMLMPFVVVFGGWPLVIALLAFGLVVAAVTARIAVRRSLQDTRALEAKS